MTIVVLIVVHKTVSKALSKQAARLARGRQISPVLDTRLRFVRRVVERNLTETELASLRTAAEAVRAKQADVASL